MKYKISPALLLTIGIFICSCNDDDPEVSPDPETDYGPEFFELVESRNDLSVYNELLEILEADKYYSIAELNFAPTDQAFQDYFSELGINGLSELSEFEIYKLDKMLRVNLRPDINGNTTQFDSMESGFYPVFYSDGIQNFNDSFNTEFSIYIEKENESDVIVNHSINCEVLTFTSYKQYYDSAAYFISSTNKSAILIIDKIYSPQTNYDIISQHSDLEEFKKLVDHAGLQDFYTNRARLTTAAPNNPAMEDFYSEINVNAVTDIDPTLAGEYVKLHTIASNITISFTPQGTTLYDSYAENTNNNRYQLIINNLANQNWKIYEAVNSSREADIIELDIATKNGSVNIINKVLLLP